MYKNANIHLQDAHASPEEALRALKAHVDRALRRAANERTAQEHVADERTAQEHMAQEPTLQDEQTPTLQRISVRTGAIDPFQWLSSLPSGTKMLWAGRGEKAVTASYGRADVVDTMPLQGAQTIEERFPLLTDENSRYFGGLRFDGERPADGDWQSFGSARFILPRLELERRESGECVLSCLLVLPRDVDARGDIQRTLDAVTVRNGVGDGDGGGDGGEEFPVSHSRTDQPEQPDWLARVQEALGEIRQTSLEKVVLARQTMFRFADTLDPFLLLKRLRAVTPSCFHFCFQPAGEAAFIGASPERLFRMEDGRLQTEAVAGTRPRGATAADDERLRTELMTNEKEQREHAFVKDQLRSELQDLCEMVSMSGSTSEMELTRGRHLYAALTGILRSDVSPLEILQRLHPTPAVGGTPTRKATDIIRSWEEFDRGWYAGPIGWIGRSSAEFAVAIRSALLSGDRLTLYAGAGIVDGSDPLAEWEEVEHKICDFVDVLGIEPLSVCHP